MKVLDTRAMEIAEIHKTLRRPEIDEVTLEPQVAARLHEIFGRPLSAAEAVAEIVQDVATRGDAAVLDYSWRIDAVKLQPETLFVSEEEMAKAQREADPTVVADIRAAAEQITAFHTMQLRNSTFMAGPGGAVLAQRILPIDRVGCYVPGGRAPLVSSALMSVIPARVAGVKEIIAATPPNRQGEVDCHILVALQEAGAHRVLKVGGAQAVAALAFGTEAIPRGDKIVGPGNIFVTLAKRQVFGRVGIDSLAGPSEIMIVADDTAPVELVAADLLSQAEHDPAAAAILVTPSKTLLQNVLDEIERQLATLAREMTARESLARWGRAVLCRDLAEACELVNVVAPEHVELLVADPWALLSQVRHAGAIFLGAASAEPIGDYVAGPNHILPTNGTARFASALGVDDFVKRSNIIAYTEAALAQLGPVAVRLADIEGLGAHAASVRRRLL